MISICVPTRGRPEIFKRFCVSVFQNATHPDNVEIISYHDFDDEALYEYVGNHTEITGPRIVISDMINLCQKIGKGDIFMFANDDLVFYTPGSDEIVRETFDKMIDDKIMFVFPNDQYYRSNWGQCGWMHKNWCDVLGYLVGPGFSSMYWDNWVEDVAAKVDRRMFLRSVVVKHLVVQDDVTHKEYLEKKVKDKPFEYFLSTEDVRQNDAQKLQRFINNHTS